MRQRLRTGLVMSLLLALPGSSHAANVSGRRGTEIIPASGGSGSGDITSVADCSTGACALADTTFGSGSGFTWTFNAGATDPTLVFGSTTVTLTPGGGDFTVADDLIISDTTGSITFDTSGKDWHLDASSNMFRVANSTDGIDAIVVNSSGQVVQLNGWRHPDHLLYWAAASLEPLEHAADGIPPIVKNLGTNVDLFTVDFDDTARETRGGTFLTPADLDTGGTVTFRVWWVAATAQTKGTVWSVNHVLRGPGVTWDAALTASTSGTSMATATASLLQEATWTASVSSLGWSAAKLVEFELAREVANAGDTLTGDAKVVGLAVQLPRNKAGNL